MIECEFENGNKNNLRHVTVDGIVIKDNSILMVKRSNNTPIAPDKWVLPGGYLERDEITEQGAAREVLEETGYSTSDPELFTIVDSGNLEDDDRQNVKFIYILKVGEKTGNPDQEVSDVQSFSLGNLPPRSTIGFEHYDLIQQYIQNLSGNAAS